MRSGNRTRRVGEKDMGMKTYLQTRLGGLQKLVGELYMYNEQHVQILKFLVTLGDAIGDTNVLVAIY